MRAAALSGSAALVLLATGALGACGSAGGGVRLEGAPVHREVPERLAATSAPAAVRSPGATGAAEVPVSPGPGISGLPEPVPGEYGEQDTAGGFNPHDQPDRVVALLRRDPKVSPRVKQGLTPCAGKWPVTVETGRATGPRGDLVVNVSSCADSVGVGTYVYRRSSSGALVNVFSAERPPVYSTIERGRLVVTRDVYLGNEPICCPSGRDVITYVWRDGVFREVGRERVDTATAEGEAGPTPSAAPERD